MEAGTKQQTIAESGRACLLLFQQCLQQTTYLHPREQSLMEDQLGRFSAWTSSIGVFAFGHASMDHRLREVPDVQNMVVALLQALDTRIQNCGSVIASIASSVPETTEEDLAIAQNRFVQSIQLVAEEISLLHKLSNTIRKASKESNNLKAAESFKIKDADGNDIEEALTKSFTNNILDHFRDSINGVLPSRLASTMLLRRKRILYRRLRYGKAPIKAQQSIPKPEVKTLPFQQRVPKDVPSSMPDRRPEFSTRMEKALQARSLVQSHAPTATTLVDDTWKKASAQSMISAAKTIMLENQNSLVFPAAPKGHIKQKYKRLEAQRRKAYEEYLENLPDYALYQEQRKDSNIDIKRFQELRKRMLGAKNELDQDLKDIWDECSSANMDVMCPYCFYSLSTRVVNNQRKWVEHVVGDLEPYVCLFDKCDEPNHLYSHSEDWLQHMRKHAITWQCKSTIHEQVQIFDSQDEYGKHMREEHSDAFTEAQLRLLAKRNARTMTPLLKACPFCGASRENGGLDDDPHSYVETRTEGRVRDLIDERLKNHIVEHLRFLALKSLPPFEDGDEDSDMEWDGSLASKAISRHTIKEDPDQGVKPVFDDEDWYSLRTERLDGHLNAAAIYSTWGGYKNYVSYASKSFSRPLTPPKNAVFRAPEVYDAQEVTFTGYPTLWSQDTSHQYVDESLIAGVAGKDLLLFEWGFVKEMQSVHNIPDSDLKRQCVAADCHQEALKCGRNCYDHACGIEDCQTTVFKSAIYCSAHICQAETCPEPATATGFCDRHKCKEPGCNLEVVSYVEYCAELHACQASWCQLKRSNKSLFCLRHTCSVEECKEGFRDSRLGGFCALHTLRTCDIASCISRSAEHPPDSRFCTMHKCQSVDCSSKAKVFPGFCDETGNGHGCEIVDCSEPKSHGCGGLCKGHWDPQPFGRTRTPDFDTEDVNHETKDKAENLSAKESPVDSSQAPIIRLRPCPRQGFSRGYTDWYTLEGCPNFDICPSCLDGAFTLSRFRAQFVPVGNRSADADIRCDFGDPWFRCAWLVILKERKQDLRLFRSIYEILEEDAEGCPGYQITTGTWFGLPDQVSRQIPQFCICRRDKELVELLFPCFRGVFSEGAAPFKCALRAGSSRLQQYLDAIDAVKMSAWTPPRLPGTQPVPAFSAFSPVLGARLDFTPLAELILSLAKTPECPRNRPSENLTWHIIASEPEITVCPECYTSVVAPDARKDAPLALSFKQIPIRIPAPPNSSGKSRALPTCQLYSGRMRVIWNTAIRNSESILFFIEARKRRRREFDIAQTIEKLRGWLSRPEITAPERQRIEKQLEDTEREWCQWE